MDERKICFIVCCNSECFFEECLFYINLLEVPEGYCIDVISVYEAKSMTSGYNEAMNATDARYKIYLHQDVFIVYKGFLQAVLDIFQSDETIGMLGMVGTVKMPVGGVMWYADRQGSIYGSEPISGDYATYRYGLEDGLHEVEAVDGLLMVTSADVPWREDLFDAWDFYDVSQSFEFRRRGYRVVVPEQKCPWCVHDCGAVNLVNFDKYRQICMTEYPEYFEPERFRIGRKEKESEEKCCEPKLRIVIIARNQFESVLSLIETLTAFSEVEERQLILVDNGSEDALRHWLPRQELDYLICEDVIEGYADILNEVLTQFVVEEDLLILTPGVMALPDCVERLSAVLYTQDNIGAVCAKAINASDGIGFVEAAEYVLGQTKGGSREIQILPYEAVLLRNEMLKAVGGFDRRLKLPEAVLAEMAASGRQKGYVYYEVQNAYVYKLEESRETYTRLLDGIVQ